MRTQRQVVDYALARRAVLADLFAGRLAPFEVLDAHPYLLRAAKYHGTVSDRHCPVCKKEALVDVTYVYGDELKESSGAARSRSDLLTMERLHGELHVYVVEVCRTCSWNHLHESYVIGTGAAKTPRKRAAQSR